MSEPSIIAPIEWIKRQPGARPIADRRPPPRAPKKSSRGHLWRSLNGSDSAMFKKIRYGGTHHPKQLAGQIAYVNGKSELVFGNGIDYEFGDAALEADAVAEMIGEWSDGWRGQPKNGHTTHLVLSFPDHVSAEQAAAIGEEWCHDMFESGEYGRDEWSYYAALHTDTANNHVHVIVNNRGLHDGQWFYMADGHDFSYQVMRQRMVEVAEPHGVYLDATTRLMRGVVEYSPTSTEYRRAIRLGIEPKGRGRYGPDLDAAYAKMEGYARECRAMAGIAENIGHKDMAEKLRVAAVDLEEARPIVFGGSKMDIDVTQHPADIRDALNAWAEEHEAKIAGLKPEDRKEVNDQLYKTLDHIETVLDKDYQVQWTDGPPKGTVFVKPYTHVVVGDKDLLRERAADYLPEGSDVSRLADLEENGGLDNYVMTGQVEAGYEAETRAWETAYADYGAGSLTDGRETMQVIRTAVAEAGIDPDKFEERLMIGASGARQEEEWAVSDIEAVVADRGLDGTQDEDIAQAVSVVSGLHRYVSDRLDDLYSRHIEYSRDTFEATTKTVVREMETYKTTVFESPAAEQEYLRAFRAKFGAASLGRMADGDLSMLEGLTKDPAEQRSIAHTVLKLEAKHKQIGVAQETIERGLELHNPALGHERDGFTL